VLNCALFVLHSTIILLNNVKPCTFPNVLLCRPFWAYLRGPTRHTSWLQPVEIGFEPRRRNFGSLPQALASIATILVFMARIVDQTDRA
jgi:hypothetical protein